MSKKTDIKFLVYIVTSYVRSQVFVEKQYFVWCVQKRQKNVLYVVVLQHQNLSFLHEPQKNVFYFENLYTNIKCLDVHVKI
jgi:hypothetical protein